MRPCPAPRRRLSTSKLGADLIYSGASSIGPAGTFYVGLKGSEVDRADAFTQLVIDTLNTGRKFGDR